MQSINDVACFASVDRKRIDLPIVSSNAGCVLQNLGLAGWVPAHVCRIFSPNCRTTIINVVASLNVSCNDCLNLQWHVPCILICHLHLPRRITGGTCALAFNLVPHSLFLTASSAFFCLFHCVRNFACAATICTLICRFGYTSTHATPDRSQYVCACVRLGSSFTFPDCKFHHLLLCLKMGRLSSRIDHLVRFHGGHNLRLYVVHLFCVLRSPSLSNEVVRLNAMYAYVVLFSAPGMAVDAIGNRF